MHRRRQQLGMLQRLQPLSLAALHGTAARVSGTPAFGGRSTASSGSGTMQAACHRLARKNCGTRLLL